MAQDSYINIEDENAQNYAEFSGKNIEYDANELTVDKKNNSGKQENHQKQNQLSLNCQHQSA